MEPAASSQTDLVIAHLIEEDRRMQAATRTYDVEALASMITDDFELFSSSGKRYGRAAFLADVGDRSLTWEINESEDVAVRIYNGDCAMVTAILHSRFRIGEKLVDVRIRYGDLWVKTRGTWLYASGHASPLA